ncbi:MAG TPA: cytochrome c [Terriglobales bacterium]
MERFRKKLPFRLAALTTGAVIVLLPCFGWAAENTGANDNGKAAYKAKCLACHAADGSGNTPVGKSLKVADLRSPEVQKKTDAELSEFIANGKGNMPSFKSSTKEEDIRAIVAYLRSLAGKDAAAPKKQATN